MGGVGTWIDSTVQACDGRSYVPIIIGGCGCGWWIAAMNTLVGGGELNRMG